MTPLEVFASFVVLIALGAGLAVMAHHDHEREYPDEGTGASTEWADRLARMNREDAARAIRQANGVDPRRWEEGDTADCAVCPMGIVFDGQGDLAWHHVFDDQATAFYGEHAARP